MPSSWRRKYSTLPDNVLEAGLRDPQLATAIRLQAILHRAWRTDPDRFGTWSTGDAEKVLTLNEVREAAGVASLRKAREKLLALSGCDPYLEGEISVTACPNPGWSVARVSGPSGPRLGAQTVRVIWRNFSKILHPHGPPSRPPAGGGRPHEGRSTKYDGERRAPAGGRRRRMEGGRVPGQVPSEGWDLPPTTRLDEWTEEERQQARRASQEIKNRLRRERGE